MKNLAASALVLLSASTLITAGLLADVRPMRPLIEQLAVTAPVCVGASLSCPSRVTGTLAPGDCTFDDGTPFDVIRNRLASSMVFPENRAYRV
jgi:hypothetical protein